MDTMVRIAALGLPVVLALVLVACRETSASADAPGALAGKKLDHYLGCFNAVDTRILMGLRPYKDWMKDPEAGPMGLESDPMGPADVSPRELTACEASFAALRRLQPLAHEASTYYARGDHRRDAFARGKALHAPLWAALVDFVQVSTQFSEALDAEVEHATRARLGGMENTGRTREYYLTALLLEARLLVDDVNEEEDFNVDLAGQRVAAFAAVVNEARITVPHLRCGGRGWEGIDAAAQAFLRESAARLDVMTARSRRSSEQQAMLDVSPVGSGSVKAVQAAIDDLLTVVPQ